MCEIEPLVLPARGSAWSSYCVGRISIHWPSGSAMKYRPMRGVLPDDTAHLLVEFMESVEIVHGECDVGVLAAVVVRLHLPAVPGELDLEGRLVVCHKGVGPGAVFGAHLAHHLHAERLLIELDGCFLA